MMANHTVGPYCRVCLTKNNFQKPFKNMQYVLDVTELILPGMSLYLQVNKDSLVCDKCYFFLLAVENFRTQIIESHRMHWSNGVMSCSGCHTNNTNFQKFLSVVNSYSSVCVNPVENSSITTDLNAVIKLPGRKTITDITVDRKTKQTCLPKKSLKPENTAVKRLRAKRIKKHKTNECELEENVIINDLTDISAITEDDSELLNFKQFVGNKNQSVVNILSNVVVQKQVLRDTIDQTIEKVIVRAFNHTNSNELKKQNDSVEKRNIIQNDDPNECVTITISDVCESSLSNEGITLISDDDEIRDSRESVIVSGTSQKSNIIPVNIKTEVMEEDNPGFFNRKNEDGFYNCRLCCKKYKTSLGLYHHTREKHQEVKIHHCVFCNFFSLWKSALVRHNSMYHAEHFEDPSQELSCFHCSFTSFNKEELSKHILEKHVNKPDPVTCGICNENFANIDACDEHVSAVHMLNVQGNVAENPEVCSEDFEDPSQQLSCFNCSFTSFNKEELSKHILEKHSNRPDPVSCAICNENFTNIDACNEHVSGVHMLNVQGNVAENSEVCVICNMIVDNGELETHNKDVHRINNWK